jgi:hypothetical protein
MLGCSSLFSSPSDSLEDTLLLYKRVIEQYKDEKILAAVKSLIPDDINLLYKIICRVGSKDRNICPQPPLANIPSIYP